MIKIESQLFEKFASLHLQMAMTLAQICTGVEQTLDEEAEWGLEPWIPITQFLDETNVGSHAFLTRVFKGNSLPKNIAKRVKNKYFLRKDALINYFLNSESARMRNQAKLYLKNKEKQCQNIPPSQPID